ncbi:hypothetical protein EFY87_02265 [Flexivirga caeni]|uniref:Pyrrolo-quinoline quinone n=2 Tax=Flexivirga caeni TaxID=2294115 RepID=A0A3M9MIS3_9MICO|nr:hypothetical protein EFY87_02265 [Flexivirga caeni]
MSTLTDDLGRPIRTTTRASVLPVYDAAPPAPATATAGSAPAYDQGEPGSLSRRRLLLGGAGVVVLAGAATAGYVTLRGNSSTPKSSPTAATGSPLPDGLQPPAGLPASYLWLVVNLSDIAPRLAVTGSQLICTVDNDTTGGTQLVSLDATSGKAQWKADLPLDAILAGGPTLCPIDGSTSILLVSQNQIMAYPLGGGDPKTWPLQHNWNAPITPSGVIVTKPGDPENAYVLLHDTLTRRAVEKGTNPVAVLRDGTVVTTDLHGHVWLSADGTKAPKPTTLQAPKGTVPGTFVAATQNQLITAFVPRDRPTASMLRSFSLPDLTPRMTTAAIEPAVFPSTFMLAPDESWAVGSNTWINMATGDTRLITARWSPIAISAHNTWSKSGESILTADDTGKYLGPAKETGGQVIVPRGGTAQLAFCAGSVANETTLYAVPVTPSAE